jgi:hypothetical protein
MVTFTLTPDNANEIPRNVVHLMVAEGVTEIPAALCFRDFKGFESLETVVFAKSVVLIRSRAFDYCTKLKSVVFPNDSQLREIGTNAFRGCKSLLSIDIPDSVTTIGLWAFIDCTNLESVLFTDQSCLRVIGKSAFYRCTSLQSIIIPSSVTEIGGAFSWCSKLKSVIFGGHSSIQTINGDTFYKCTSLLFINIPTTVTYIDENAFGWCYVLQVIDIPLQAVVDPDAFENSHLLSTTLEAHGTNCMKGRFDALPIHQACYNFNNNANHANYNIINYFYSLQDNDPTLLQVDIMGMTPLHILCANPAVTKDMIKQLYSKNTEAAAVRNLNDMLPWHMFVVNKDKQFCMFKTSTTMTDTARMILSNEFDKDTLVNASLDIETKEMYLTLTGSSLTEWLETANTVTGLYPFMSMAKSSTYNLEDVYDFAMMNLNSIQRDCVLQESKNNKAIHTNERTGDAKRVKLA